MNTNSQTQLPQSQFPLTGRMAKEYAVKNILFIVALALMAGCGFEGSKSTQANLGDVMIASNAEFKYDLRNKEDATIAPLTGASAVSSTDANTHLAELSGIPAGTYVAVLSPVDTTFEQKTMDLTVHFGSNNPISVIFAKSAGTTDTTALEAAIKALQDAITGGDPASVKTALANLATAIAAVNGAVGDLQADIDTLKDQAKSLLFPGIAKVTCTDLGQTVLAGCVVVEVNVTYADSAVRSCTTDATGVCEIKYLPKGEPLIFHAVMSGFMPFDMAKQINTSAPLSLTFQLHPSGATGDLICWVGQKVAAGATRDIRNTVMQVQANGSVAVVTADGGLGCTIKTGANAFGVDLRCETLTGLDGGCGVYEAAVGAKKCSIPVRVTGGAGTPASCP